MPIDELTERNTHLLLDGDRVIDMTGNAKQLGTGIVLTAEALEPGGSSSHDCWAHGNLSLIHI